jgi:hypothetical protein
MSIIRFRDETTAGLSLKSERAFIGSPYSEKNAPDDADVAASSGAHGYGCGFHGSRSGDR